MATDLLTILARVGAILFGTCYTFFPIMRFKYSSIDAVGITIVILGIVLLSLGFLHPILVKIKIFNKYYFEIVSALIVAGIAINILIPYTYTSPGD